MKIKYSKEEEIEMIKFLSYRLRDPKGIGHSQMSQTDIAKFLSKSTAYVSKICWELREGKYAEEVTTLPGQVAV